jgi:ABC-type lipoprotein export system ATPase subunit/ABC-type lipoprotein release transport system permease subunit
MAELSIKGVSKFYKLGNKSTFQALSDINLEFEKGELVSIIGESGSGKSTLMNIIGGLDSDFEGEIIAGGENLRELKDKGLDSYRKRKVGFVFQSFNLIPHLSILDNVTIALTLSNVDSEEKVRKATEVLSKLGLEKHLKKKPNQLSGGQKQRVAIARALINDPEIILADEPTGALDSETSFQILDILKSIADEGKLVIMVTHSEKIASISSRIVEISDGKVIRDEKSKTYQHKEVEKFISEEPKKKKNGNLSFFQAIRLSFHNMWASKTKNFLMAFGVSISLISLILMLSLGSGLTGYISGLADSYSSPEIVTISKRSEDPFSALSPGTFTDDEIAKVKDDINAHLEEKGNDFRVQNAENISYGWSQLTGFTDQAMISYTINEDGEDVEKDAKIFYVYTTPTYYTTDNLLAGEISGNNEIMLSSAILKLLGYTKYEEVIGKQVTITFNKYVRTVTISAIVDVNMFADMLIMYVDYDFLNGLVELATGEKLEPTSIFIKTDGLETTKLINDYIKTREDLTGQLEETMANMFSEMLSTFSTAMIIISVISLTVATIMILTVLYMSVSERTREIGVLKSIGARKKDIRLIFSTESFLIGLLSGIVGIVLSLIVGGILTLILNALLGFAPIAFVWYYYLIALGVSVVISVLAGLYPASRASKLDPVESLRHE